VVATGPLSSPSCLHLPAWRTCRRTSTRRRGTPPTTCTTSGSPSLAPRLRGAVHPAIQPQVDPPLHLQRTPPWVIPRWDRRKDDLTGRPSGRCLSCSGCADRGLPLAGGAHPRADGRAAPAQAAEWLPTSSRARVDDPRLRAALTRLPARLQAGHPVNNYYPAIAQPNTELVPSEIVGTGRDSIVCVDGNRTSGHAIIFTRLRGGQHAGGRAPARRRAPVATTGETGRRRTWVRP